MNIFANSIPKSGTNLLQRFLDLSDVQYSGRSIAASSVYGRYGYLKHLLHQPNAKEIPIPIGLDVPVVVSPKWLQSYLHNASGYITGHAQYSNHFSHILISENYKVIQIYRHPGAVLVSWAHYIVNPGYYWSDVCYKMAKLSLQQRIRLMVRGGELENTYYTGIVDIIQRSEGWLHDRNTLTIRFEDLVGSNGGGDDIIQKDTMKTILKYIGISKNERELDTIQASLFGATHTFREGQIDRWKEEVDHETLKLMKETLSNMKFIEILKYSFDNN